jgi:hypothetical protein
MKINFFDSNIGNDPYSNIYRPISNLEYIKPPLIEFDGITVFTDELCFHPIVDQVKSKYKIAWAFESPAIKPYVYEHIHKIEHKFDYIYVCNPDLHRNEKYKQCFFGGCWITEDACKIYDKTKLLSIVASNKNYTTGHKLRHEVISKKLHPEIELWGSGYRKFSDNLEGRLSPLKDYRYVIVIENCQHNGYFTEKLIDCFATGCIPIYWGNPNIDKLFDNRGFYTWNTIEELKEILCKISIQDYVSKRQYIEENFRRFRTYESPDKWMMENCYSKL